MEKGVWNWKESGRWQDQWSGVGGWGGGHMHRWDLLAGWCAVHLAKTSTVGPFTNLRSNPDTDVCVQHTSQKSGSQF